MAEATASREDTVARRHERPPRRIEAPETVAESAAVEAPVSPKHAVAAPPGALKPRQVLSLQRTVGNRSVRRLLATRRHARTADVAIARPAPEPAEAMEQEEGASEPMGQAPGTAMAGASAADPGDAPEGPAIVRRKPAKPPVLKALPRRRGPRRASRLVANAGSSNETPGANLADADQATAADAPTEAAASTGAERPFSEDQAAQPELAEAVTAVTRSIAQRVAVTGTKTTETLYNQPGAGGAAGAKQYSMTANYEMTRAGDTGATVTVKIKFLSQARNTTPPPNPNPAGLPELGAHTGPQTEIPAGDDRRAWATTMAADAVTSWNGRLTLVGEEWNMFSDNTKKRLPVTFRAVPVFGMGDEAHNTVIVYPKTVVGGSQGNPIDAGNYYPTKNDNVYPADAKIIYAHEYGHLLGIPDEYSQSNEQMNALLHEAAGGGAASSLKALDKATIERMVLSSLTQPLMAQLAAAMPTITDALRSQRKLVKTKMAAAARAGVVAAAVRDELRNQLMTASEAKLAPSVPGVVAFQTTANFSNRTRAEEGVEAGFSAAALSAQISNAYANALSGAQNAVVGVAGLGDVKINVKGSVPATTAAGGAQAAPAAGVAASTIGPAAGPGLPAVAPSASLVAQVTALPTTWATAGSAVETGVTAEAFTNKMAAALKAAAAAAAAATAALPPGVAPPPKMEKVRQLYVRAYDLVTNASQTASRQVATDLVSATVNPVLASSVSSLQATIASETAKVMTTSPSALAASGTPDPNMVAMVAAMKARLDANKAATAGTGRDPGAAAPNQDVTYSYQGLMGSNKTTALRPDQFAPVVAQFNDKLKTTFEKDFTPEVK